jgi:hypothetical protein
LRQQWWLAQKDILIIPGLGAWHYNDVLVPIDQSVNCHLFLVSPTQVGEVGLVLQVLAHQLFGVGLLNWNGHRIVTHPVCCCCVPPH